MFGVLEGRPSAALDTQFAASYPNKSHLFFRVAVGGGPAGRHAGTAPELPVDGFFQPTWKYDRLGLDATAAALVDGAELRQEIKALLASGAVEHASVAGIPYQPSSKPPLAGLGVDNTHYNHDRYPFDCVDGGLVFHVRDAEVCTWRTSVYYVQLRALPGSAVPA